MKPKSNTFHQLARQTIADEERQAAISSGTRTAVEKRIAAMAETSVEYGESLRAQAAAARRHALDNLPDLLEEAEKKMLANGIQVLWAEDADRACDLVLEVAGRHQVRNVTKSKSMVTEEIALNEALEAAGIKAVETDLGEYIIQLDEDAPSHIVTPVIHKGKDEIRKLFMDELDMPPTDDVAEMAQYARQKLRQEFLTCDMGVSGGNFIIAETGTLCLVTNEGNGRMVTSLPPVHVAVVGIEKVVASLDDYATLTQVLTRSATGQRMPVYTHMINGPRRGEEEDGPEHMYVIFVDNGRSEVYASSYAESLACIRCGACLNICPVYQTVGGHSYGWVYPGPIGSIITPLLVGLGQAAPLPHACSLCGACHQACSVKIDLPRMLLDLRRDLITHGEGSFTWQAGLSLWATGISSAGLFSLGSMIGQWVTNNFSLNWLPAPLNGWTQSRDFPTFAPQSFHEWWKKRILEGDNGR